MRYTINMILILIAMVAVLDHEYTFVAALSAFTTYINVKNY